MNFTLLLNIGSTVNYQMMVDGKCKLDLEKAKENKKLNTRW